MLQRKRMNGFAFLAIVAIALLFSFGGSVTASDPTPKFFNPAQEQRIQALELRIAALEAAVKPTFPMPAPVPAKKEAAKLAEPAKMNSLGAPVELAPAGQHWLKVGESNWVLESDTVTAPVQAAPAPVQFATPVRNFILSQTGVAVGTCKGPNCPQVVQPSVTYRR